jgi:hypothetical protein
VEVGGVLAGGRGDFLHGGSVADEHLVVTSGEFGRAGDVVIGRGLDERHADAGEPALHLVHDGGEAVFVGVVCLLLKSAEAAVVHAEHDGYDGGFIGVNVALKADVDIAADAADDPLVSPAGVGEGDVHRRETRGHKRLDKRGVGALLGDAVAVEDDMVAVLDIKAVRRGGRGGALSKKAGRKKRKRSQDDMDVMFHGGGKGREGRRGTEYLVFLNRISGFFRMNRIVF